MEVGISPDLGSGAPRGIGKQIQEERIITLLEESSLPTIAALSHVVRNSGNYDLGTGVPSAENEEIWGFSKVSP